MLPAGQRCVAPYIYAAGITPLPERKMVDKTHRRTFNVMVGLQLGKPPIVRQVTGSVIPLLPEPKQYMTKKGEKAKSLTAGEFQDNILAMCREGAKTRSGIKMVVYDKDRTHSNAVEEKLEERGVRVIKLSPRSPDLTPLDAAFFGALRKKFGRYCMDHELTFPDQCSAFVRLIEQMSADNSILHMQRVWKEVAAGGGARWDEVRHQR